MNTDSTGLKKLTNEPGQNNCPKWSPDPLFRQYRKDHFLGGSDLVPLRQERLNLLADDPLFRMRWIVLAMGAPGQ